MVYHGREIRRDFFNIYIYKNSKYKTKGGRFCLASRGLHEKHADFQACVDTKPEQLHTRKRERESLCVCASEKEKGVRGVMQ